MILAKRPRSDKNDIFYNISARSMLHAMPTAVFPKVPRGGGDTPLQMTPS